MKDILKKTAIESTRDVKHVLATLLHSLTRYLTVLNYHGNINPQTITALSNSQRQSEKLATDKVSHDALIGGANHGLGLSFELHPLGLYFQARLVDQENRGTAKWQKVDTLM